MKLLILSIFLISSFNAYSVDTSHKLKEVKTRAALGLLFPFFWFIPMKDKSFKKASKNKELKKRKKRKPSSI